MSDTPLDPGEEDPTLEETTTDDGDDEETARVLVPRTATTARAWLAARAQAAADAERILAMEQIAAAREHVRATLKRWQIEAETSDIPF